MEVHFKHSKTYRYQILNDSQQAKTVLYVLHGYGQLVKFFIRKFKEVDPSILIVAPEGMHRFYRKGTSGRVGASWMTKEARETDIADNIGYLNALDAEITSKYPIEKRLLLGFSQGGATASRWKTMGQPSFDALIVWGSDFPLDANWKDDFKNEKNNYFVVGNQDEFFDATSRQLLSEQYVSLGFNIENYEGKHDIETKTLNSIITKIQK